MFGITPEIISKIEESHRMYRNMMASIPAEPNPAFEEIEKNAKRHKEEIEAEEKGVKLNDGIEC
jgi:predicted O-methyltransferase YrrM